MPFKSGNVRQELKFKMEGLMMHCADLTNFMSEHRDDAYFQTEEGKKVLHHVLDICAGHAMAMMSFMTTDLLKKKQDEKKDEDSIDIEQMLKDILP